MATQEPGRVAHRRDTRLVLFIVTSFWAFGELAIATELAQRMRGTGFRPLFLIPPTHRDLIAGTGLAHQLLIPGAGKINRIQLHDIQHVHRPALVILADFLNFDFCERHYGLLREDLRIFDCPVGTLDDFTWGRPGSWLDTYGFKAKYENDICLDGLSFRLRPCPLNNPVADHSEPGVYAYPMLRRTPDGPAATTTAIAVGTDGADSGHGAAGGGDDTARAVRAELGVPDGKPLVVITSATWQQMHAAYPRVKAFVTACTAMLEHLLRELLKHAAVVSVGPPIVFKEHPPPGFRAVGQVEPPVFRRLTKAVDLHISNNIVSVSLHRLALAGIPSVALYSSLSKVDGVLSWADQPVTDQARDVIDGIDYLYPFRMFPVGWYHFLQSLMADNPFADVVSHAEIFREEQALDTILPLLTAGPERSRVEAARLGYLSALDRLPDVGTILTDLSA